MKRLLSGAGLALAAVLLLSTALPAVAQQAPRDQVPFRLTLTGPLNIPDWVLPLSPPILFARHTAAGEAAGLGKFNYLDEVAVQLGVDENPLSMNNGIGVLMAENGDAIFLAFSGPVRSTADPNVFAPETTFTVTGGKGRFLGATGSGVLRGTVDV